MEHGEWLEMWSYFKIHFSSIKQHFWNKVSPVCHYGNLCDVVQQNCTGAASPACVWGWSHMAKKQTLVSIFKKMLSRTFQQTEDWQTAACKITIWKSFLTISLPQPLATVTQGWRLAAGFWRKSKNCCLHICKTTENLLILHYLI